jgi:hypothetical protein
MGKWRLPSMGRHFDVSCLQLAPCIESRFSSLERQAIRLFHGS